MAFRLKHSAAGLGFVLLLFFASGFSALLYQTIWQRMLGFFSGVDVYSVTITVAAFMGGLGCGSLAGGHWADRLSAKRRLLVFAAAEAVIALFALRSKWFYYDLLYQQWHTLSASPVLLPLVLFVSLLVPTFCMGLTLPILAKTFTATIEKASSVVGYLYGVNTLGAAVGALVTPWILLRRFGFGDILAIGAGLNAVCAIGAVFLWWRRRGETASVPPETNVPGSPLSGEASRFPARVWILIYALSGFIALALEIVWFRLLGVLQKSTAFTFPTLLAVYLGGLAAGVMIGVPFAKRTRRPAVTFLALQGGITLYAGGAFALLLHHVSRREFLKPLWTYLGGYEPVNAADMLAAMRAWILGAEIAPALGESARFGLFLYFVLPLFLIAPATLLMGLSFPFLQRLVQDNALLLGRRVGWLQTLNIVGSMLGAMVVGWWLLGWLGSTGTFRLLVILGGGFLILAAWQSTQQRWSRLVGLAVSLVLVGWVASRIPAASRLWAKLHGAAPRAIIAREGASGLAVLKGHQDGFEKEAVWVFTNGIGQSWLPFGGVHSQIGLLAVALHPNPAEVAVIGLGSGDTVYALGGSPHTTEVTCIEIIDGIRSTLTELAPRITYSALDSLLADSRVQWISTDGRAYILRSGKKFDVIEADALRPNSAYSGNLYSWEYFTMLKAHLKPDGLAITWAPTDRVLASFLAVFPHAILVDGIAIGSQQPIATDRAEILARLSHPFTSEHYRRLERDLQPLMTSLLAGHFQRFFEETQRPARRDLNSDLFPKDEYMVPPQL